MPGMRCEVAAKGIRIQVRTLSREVRSVKDPRWHTSHVSSAIAARQAVQLVALPGREVDSRRPRRRSVPERAGDVARRRGKAVAAASLRAVCVSFSSFRFSGDWGPRTNEEGVAGQHEGLGLEDVAAVGQIRTDDELHRRQRQEQRYEQPWGDETPRALGRA